MRQKAKKLMAFTIFFSCLVGCVSAPQKEDPAPPSGAETANAVSDVTPQASSNQAQVVNDLLPESGAGAQPADAVQASEEATVSKSRAAVLPVVKEQPSVQAVSRSTPTAAIDEPQTPAGPEPSPVSKGPAPDRQLGAKSGEKAAGAEIMEVAAPSETQVVSEINDHQLAASEQDVEMPSYDRDVGEPTAGMTVAMIEDPLPPTVRGPDPATMVFDEEHLPVEFEGGWVLDKRSSLVDGEIQCLILSPWTDIFDGYDKTQIQIQVADATVAVRSKSNLDSSYEQQGLVVDGGELFAFEAPLVDEQTTYAKGPAQVAMSKGRTLGVALGFWPTWPVTTTQHASIDLLGFPEAYAALRACVQQ